MSGRLPASAKILVTHGIVAVQTLQDRVAQVAWACDWADYFGYLRCRALIEGGGCELMDACSPESFVAMVVAAISVHLHNVHLQCMETTMSVRRFSPAARARGKPRLARCGAMVAD